jgi:hypothetical protein
MARKIQGRTMIETEGRRFVRAESNTGDLRDAIERAERAEALERCERRRRLEAELLNHELAEIVACEVTRRRHAEEIAAELQALASGIPPTPAIPALPPLLA